MSVTLVRIALLPSESKMSLDVGAVENVDIAPTTARVPVVEQGGRTWSPPNLTPPAGATFGLLGPGNTSSATAVSQPPTVTPPRCRGVNHNPGGVLNPRPPGCRSMAPLPLPLGVLRGTLECSRIGPWSTMSVLLSYYFKSGMILSQPLALLFV